MGGRTGEVAFDRLAGSPVVAGITRNVVRPPLRVLGYHHVIDPDGFFQQMEHLAAVYRPVTATQVIRWLEGERLPQDAVWVTFDDGDPTIVEEGLPVLRSLGIPATMFVCPGVVDTVQPYWWQVAEILDPDQIPMLKTIADDERRRRVQEMIERLREEESADIECVQLTEADIKKWVEAGNDVGNHTWDHPLLDRCSPAEQERQIVSAHEWMMDVVRPERLLFAYPNGNSSADARAVLDRLGYDVALLFDHKNVSGREREMSRLRTNADGDLARFRSIVSGIHPLVHQLRSGGAIRPTPITS